MLQKEGYAAVTARRLAEEVGLKREIVHYYFRTLDDLFVAVIRRQADAVRLALAQAVESDEPLRAIWELRRNPTATYLEFIALANRSPVIQAEVKRLSEEFRRTQTEALERHVERRGFAYAAPPVTIVFTLHSLLQTLAIEKALQISDGHPQVESIIEQYLRSLEQPHALRRKGAGKPVRRRRGASAR